MAGEGREIVGNCWVWGWFMAITKAQLEAKFSVPVYVRWHLVPINLHPRSWFAAKEIKIPKSTKPDGVKGGGMTGNHYTFLFSEEKYLPEEMRTKFEAEICERPRLKVNFER